MTTSSSSSDITTTITANNAKDTGGKSKTPILTPEQLKHQQERRKELNIPDGMSKKQWKKEQKKLRWDEQKEDFKLARRDKKKKLRLQRKEMIRQALANGEELPKREKLYKLQEQELPIAKILIDCEFDDMMSLKEVISLSSQITRCYAANRRTQKPVMMEISSFNKRLKKRFDEDLPQYHLWKQNVNFINDNLESLIKQEEEQDKKDQRVEKKKFIYLTADTDDKLENLEPNMTYILGGIVDKGRYKNLCLEKAQSLGIPVKRLPIDEFIKLSGRRVLATSHVFELLVKWFELKDWKQLFELVLPERKLKLVKNGGEDDEEDEEEDIKEVSE